MQIPGAEREQTITAIKKKGFKLRTGLGIFTISMRTVEWRKIGMLCGYVLIMQVRHKRGQRAEVIAELV